MRCCSRSMRSLAKFGVGQTWQAFETLTRGQASACGRLWPAIAACAMWRLLEKDSKATHLLLACLRAGLALDLG